MNKKYLWLLSLLSGGLMALSWVNVMSMGFLMLIAFIPLLFIEDFIANNNTSGKFSPIAIFIYSYPAFFIFSFANTWWIGNASFWGYVIPVAEATFMSFVFQLYSFSKKIVKQRQSAYFFILFYWIALEYLQFSWDINFPWLNLGNSFASYPILIQWYSVLGMEGGTLWILLSNILIYFLIISKYQYKKPFQKITFRKEFALVKKESSKVSSYFQRYKYMFFAITIIVVPIVWSFILWTNYHDNHTKNANVLIVQPNLDPYNEQYILSPEQVITRIKKIATPVLNENTNYLILPESCIQEYAWEDLLDRVPSIETLKHFIKNTKNCEIIAGMSSRKILPYGTKSEAAREIPNIPKRYYESCNTALMFNKTSSQNDIQLRHKSILVVGVEKLPFKKYLPFVEKLALNMGGSVGTLGIDTSISNFYSKTNQTTIGVPICWESIDGNYTRMFVKNGADFLQIITNVGWWGDTPGYKQYFAMSRLRAIENRRYVSICANTGFSGLVNARGETISRGKYWEQEVFEYNIPLLKNKTFFTKHGDMIMQPFAFFSVLLLLYSIIKKKTENKEEIK
ncbi:MAG: apolipoprotein N-acyltransferase [Bacteroidales bacterium]